MLKVKMLPHLSHFRSEESGIKRVVEAYTHYLPRFDVEIVEPDATTFDVSVAHAGMAGKTAMCSHLHGLYWTADYHADAWEWRANAAVIESIRAAKQVTVPSEWVAESLRRDMHLNPHVVPHGIDYRLWDHTAENAGYVLWNKNRAGVDVCSPEPVGELAKQFPNMRFLTTFAPDKPTPNIRATGTVKHDVMKQMVEHAAVYLASVKETFGIGILESLAAGVPVLGFRHGGVCDIVRHGVEGYLAEPGNYEDLAAGLDYCLKHRGILAANARERAKAFTWEAVAEQVARIYHLAALLKEPTVSAIIPCYNYGHMLERAVTSVLNQTHPVDNIIIVDDGSTDDTPTIANDLAARDNRVRYIRQDNSGVAHARNRGIRATYSTFVFCLDADDRIEPQFVERCADALEADRSLGIAYTRLQWVKPDGTTGRSDWPGEWNFDKQLKRQNQVPTCAVFRRSMWEALGGYRQRYAPTGAGSEDAEFWTRAGAYGWGAVLATEEPLFVYSWGSGATSAKDYHETDWLSDKPWVHDGLHPFASLATPRKWSHPVRQYDSPVVSVIIPVGPGHEEYLVDALDSVENQSFRQWEVIVVWDAGGGSVNAAERYQAAFPFARFVFTRGKLGAGVARNIGASHARAPFIVFLDADDMLHMRALESMLDAWESTEAIAYTDYLGTAHVEDVSKLDEKLQRRIVSRNEKTNETTIMHEAFDYDWQRAQRQPEGNRPYIWCNVTCLIPTSWHNEIGGFDESMHSWEDVDYHYRMAMRGKPYVRIPEPLMTYRFFTGARRESGRQDHQNLIEYLREKYKRIEKMACNSCGKSRHSAAAPKMMMNVSRAAPEMNDENYVMVKLVDGNRGNHPIVGAITKNRYGYRSHGDTFLMHQDDIAAQPGKFREVVKAKPITPPAEKQPTPEPQLVTGAEVEEPEAESRASLHIGGARDIAALIATQSIDESRPFDLQLMPGVTPAIAKQLREHGADTLESLAEWSVDDLQEKIKGVGEARAEQIRAYVEEQID